MRGRTASVIISGGSATYENFSNTIQDGNSAMDCATFSMKFTRRRDIRESRFKNRFTIHDVTSLILFTLVFSWRHDAIVNRVRMKHYRDQVEEKETGAKSRRCDRGKKYENPSGNRASHPQETRQSVTF